MPVALTDRPQQCASKCASPSSSSSSAATPADDLRRIWDKYKHHKTHAIRNRLIDHYMAQHVKPIAERLHVTLPKCVDINDLIQQGYLGLVDAMERFDPERNTRFETFSRARIYGAMRDYLRAQDPLSRLARIRSRRIEAACEQFQKSHGRPPSDDELLEQLGDSLAFPGNRVWEHQAPITISFHGLGETDESSDEGNAIDNLVDHRHVSPVFHGEQSDFKAWLTRGFNRRDRLIIILYYYEEMTMKEVGKTIGWSESRVSQRLDSIISQLRARLSIGGSVKEVALMIL